MLLKDLKVYAHNLLQTAWHLAAHNVSELLYWMLPIHHTRSPDCMMNTVVSGYEQPLGLGRRLWSGRLRQRSVCIHRYAVTSAWVLEVSLWHWCARV